MNRSEIRNLARFWLNEATAGFYSDADLNTLIDIANQKVNAEVSKVRTDYFEISSTYETQANVKTYANPSDFVLLRRLELYDTSDENEIRYLYELPVGEDSNYTSPGKPRRYRFKGSGHELIPTPDTVYPMRMYYSTRKNNLSQDTDVPSSPLESHDLISLYATILALPANNESADEYKAIWGDRLRDMVDLLSIRTGGVERVIGYME